MIGCEFGLCRRPAEIEVVLGEGRGDPLRVCGLHVAPVVSWGVPEPAEALVLRYLESA